MISGTNDDGRITNRRRRELRLAIVVSHPIQHFVPFYRALSAVRGLQTCVFFASRIGLQRYYDEEMEQEIAWAQDLTSGYQHVFLPEADNIRQVRWRTVNNPSISTHLSAFGPDAVLLYGYSTLTNLRALIWAKSRGVPPLLIGDSTTLTQRSGSVQMLRAVVMPLLYALFRAFLSVGDTNEAHYRRYQVPERKLFRSPFTIDESAYLFARRRRDVLRDTARRQWGIVGDRVVLLAVGKLNRQKRHADMIEALSRVDAVLRPILVIAGHGAERATLERLADRHGVEVKFLGFVNVDRLPEVYAAADVLLHISDDDRHPLALSEAACVGLPVIVSDSVGAVGATDIARPGVNALVVPVGDINAIASSIASLVEQPALREQMARSAIDVFMTQSINESVAGLLRALSSVLPSCASLLGAPSAGPDAPALNSARRP